MLRGLTVSLVLLGTSGASLAADGLKIDPGMWEMTNQMTMSLMPQPVVRTHQECMTQSKLTAEDLTKDTDCKLEAYDVSGNTMTFTMICPGPEGATQAQGTYVSNGDSGHGEMNMSMVIEGSTQTMKMTFKGKRVGAC